jgi:hypothetical protein
MKLKSILKTRNFTPVISGFVILEIARMASFGQEYKEKIKKNIQFIEYLEPDFHKPISKLFESEAYRVIEDDSTHYIIDCKDKKDLDDDMSRLVDGYTSQRIKNGLYFVKTCDKTAKEYNSINQEFIKREIIKFNSTKKNYIPIIF